MERDIFDDLQDHNKDARSFRVDGDTPEKIFAGRGYGEFHVKVCQECFGSGCPECWGRGSIECFIEKGE